MLSKQKWLSPFVIKQGMFAVLALACLPHSPAFAQIAVQGEASFTLMERVLTVEHVRNLTLGKWIRSGEASPNILLRCGTDGTPVTESTLETVPGGAIECGQVDVTAGSANQTFVMNIGAESTDFSPEGAGADLETVYAVYHASGKVDMAEAGQAGDGSSPITTTGNSSTPISFYIGTTVTLAADSAFGNYTSTYEVVATVQ